MSRTIKEKSRKENSYYFIESKGKFSLCTVKENKRREFLNNFLDRNYADDFSTEKIYIESSYKHRRFTVNGNARYVSVRDITVHKRTVTLEEEISREFSDIYDDSIGHDPRYFVADYDYYSETYFYEYLGRERNWDKECTQFIAFAYIQPGRFEYFFGKNFVPFWRFVVGKETVEKDLILARMAGITPAILAEKAGVSKKTAREIYSQVRFDWTKVIPIELAGWWETKKYSLPENLTEICGKLPPAYSKIISNIWRNNRESFFEQEKISEMGVIHKLPDYAERIYNVVAHYRRDFPELNKEFGSAKSLLKFLEEHSLSAENIQKYRLMACEGIKQIVSAPREIYKMGTKYFNCLRYRAFSWDEDSGYVVETETGCVFQYDAKYGIIMEAKRMHNNAITMEDNAIIQKFVEINKPFTREEEEDD